MKNRSAAFLVVITAVVFGLFSSAECMTADKRTVGESEGRSGGVESLAVDFKLRDINNIEVSLSDYIGKQPVVLFFWTTWCPYCVKELSNLNPKYLELKQEGCEVLAVNLGESADKVNRYVKKYNPLFKILLDKDKSLASSFDVLGVPTYIFINKKGEIAAREHVFPDDYKEIISQ